MKSIVSVLVTAFALLLMDRFVPGIAVSSLSVALGAGVVLAIAHSVIRPVLIILTLPITILSLGLFIIIINGALFYIAANFISGFEVVNFWYAVVGSVLLSMAHTLFAWMGK